MIWLMGQGFTPSFDRLFEVGAYLAVIFAGVLVIGCICWAFRQMARVWNMFHKEPRDSSHIGE